MPRMTARMHTAGRVTVACLSAIRTDDALLRTRSNPEVRVLRWGSDNHVQPCCCVPGARHVPCVLGVVRPRVSGVAVFADQADQWTVLVVID